MLLLAPFGRSAAIIIIIIIIGVDLREQWKLSLFLQSIFCLPCWKCENVSRVLVVYSQVAWKSIIYHAQQHPNILNCTCFVHQIFKKRICYSFNTFVSFHQSLKNELHMLHIHLASFLSSRHHCLKNETNYYTIIPLVLPHYGLKTRIYYIPSLLKIWAT